MYICTVHGGNYSDDNKSDVWFPIEVVVVAENEKSAIAKVKSIVERTFYKVTHMQEIL
jgi:hypothetical protein